MLADPVATRAARGGGRAGGRRGWGGRGPRGRILALGHLRAVGGDRHRNRRVAGYLRPSYAFRNVAVAAPFVWIAAGALIDLCLTLPSRRAALAAALAIAATTTYAGLRPPPAAGATRERSFARPRGSSPRNPVAPGRPIAVLRSDITGYTPAGLRTIAKSRDIISDRSSDALPLIDLSPGAERFPNRRRDDTARRGERRAMLPGAGVRRASVRLHTARGDAGGRPRNSGCRPRACG